MKRIALLFTLILLIGSCSKEDTPNDLINRDIEIVLTTTAIGSDYITVTYKDENEKDHINERIDFTYENLTTPNPIIIKLSNYKLPYLWGNATRPNYSEEILGLKIYADGILIKEKEMAGYYNTSGQSFAFVEFNHSF